MRAAFVDKSKSKIKKKIKMLLATGFERMPHRQQKKDQKRNYAKIQKNTKRLTGEGGEGEGLTISTMV